MKEEKPATKLEDLNLEELSLQEEIDSLISGLRPIELEKVVKRYDRITHLTEALRAKINTIIHDILLLTNNNYRLVNVLIKDILNDTNNAVPSADEVADLCEDLTTNFWNLKKFISEGDYNHLLLSKFINPNNIRKK